MFKILFFLVIGFGAGVFFQSPLKNELSNITKKTFVDYKNNVKTILHKPLIRTYAEVKKKQVNKKEEKVLAENTSAPDIKCYGFHDNKNYFTKCFTK